MYYVLRLTSYAKINNKMTNILHKMKLILIIVQCFILNLKNYLFIIFTSSLIV